MITSLHITSHHSPRPALRLTDLQSVALGRSARGCRLTSLFVRGGCVQRERKIQYTSTRTVPKAHLTLIPPFSPHSFSRSTTSRFCSRPTGSAMRGCSRPTFSQPHQRESSRRGLPRRGLRLRWQRWRCSERSLHERETRESSRGTSTFREKREISP